MITRPYKSEDYAKVSLWWKDHEFTLLPESVLPKVGFVVEDDEKPIIVSWLYKDASAPLGFLTWVTSNPEAPVMSVARALKQMIDGVKEYATKNSIQLLFTCTNHKLLSEYFQNNGFKVTDKESTEMVWIAGEATYGS